MRLTIYPRNPILRLALLIFYFLGSLKLFYLLRPHILEYVDMIVHDRMDHVEFANTIMATCWFIFWIFISFGFILEVLQKPGKGRMRSEIGDIESLFLYATVIATGFGMALLGQAMFEFESYVELLKNSIGALALLGSGLTLICLIAIIRPEFYRRLKEMSEAKEAERIRNAAARDQNADEASTE